MAPETGNFGFFNEAGTALRRIPLKLLWLLQSRKFWVAVATIVFLALGIEDDPSGFVDELMKAVGTIITSAVYLYSVAYEDAHS